MVPIWVARGVVERAPRFFCEPCWEDCKRWWSTPLKGIDKPAKADDDWQPSLSEHFNWALIDMVDQQRWDSRDVIAAQQRGGDRMRELFRKYRNGELK